MTPRHFGRHRRSGAVWGAVLLSGALGAPALASDAALNQCRLEKVAAQRLACYDAIPTQAPGAASAQAPARPAAAAPATAPSPAAAPAPAAASRFGLPSAPDEAVESRIPGRFEGWGPKTRFTLANGQVWEVEDASNASLWLDGPAVRVRRGFAGAYYLEIEGTNRSPRVRRLQ
jgi:hypothetical protein